MQLRDVRCYLLPRIYRGGLRGHGRQNLPDAPASRLAAARDWLFSRTQAERSDRAIFDLLAALALDQVQDLNLLKVARGGLGWQRGGRKRSRLDLKVTLISPIADQSLTGDTCRLVHGSVDPVLAPAVLLDSKLLLCPPFLPAVLPAAVVPYQVVTVDDVGAGVAVETIAVDLKVLDRG